MSFFLGNLLDVRGTKQENMSSLSGSLPPKFDKGNGIVTANSRWPNIYRDGGGGGKVNGKNIIMFSDTTTTNGGQDGQMVGFTSNSIAYLDPRDPTKLTDFGDGIRPNLGIPFLPEEANWTTANWESRGERMVIWPESKSTFLCSNINAIGPTTGIFVAPIAVFTKKITGWDLYNSLVTIEARDTGPVITRIVPRLFAEQDGEVNWGKFGCLLNRQTNMLNFFGKDKSGIKVARAPLTGFADRSQWTFWNGSTYTPMQPMRDDPNSNIIIDGISSGDIFWSRHFRTFLCVYFGTFPGTFRLRYSLDGTLEGKWSGSKELFDTKPGKKVQYNFAGHAYPGYDETGKTLLLSWTYDGNYTRMTRITFE